MRSSILARAFLIACALMHAWLIDDAVASEITLTAGPVFEYNFYGEPGVAAGISHVNILGGCPHLELSYTTSRGSFWNGPYALKTDNILATVVWEFLPKNMVNPFSGIDIGYSRYDLDEDEVRWMLDNDAARLNIRTGVRLAFPKIPVVSSLEGGFAIITSSTVFPLFFRVGLAYVIMEGRRS